MRKNSNQLSDHTPTEPSTPPNIESIVSSNTLHRIISSNEELICQQMQTIRALQTQLFKLEQNKQQIDNKYQTLLDVVKRQKDERNMEEQQKKQMTVDKLLDKIIELEHELSKTKVQLAIESNSLLTNTLHKHQEEEQQMKRRNTEILIHKTELREYFETKPVQRDSILPSPHKQKNHTEQWNKIIQQYANKTHKIKEKTTNLIKKFIPQQLRSKVWPALMQNKIGITNSLYMYLLQRREQGWVCDKVKTQIAKDIKRSFYGKTNYQTKNSTIMDVTQFLQLFHIFRPDISYVQGMTYPAIILIPILGKIKAFNIFCNLILSNHFFRQLFTLQGNFVSQVSRCFEVLLEQYQPNTFNLLKQLGIQSQIFLIEWLFTFFSRGLSLQTTLKLWDHLLFYEQLAIFRMSLSVFEQLSPLLQETTYEESINSIRQYCENISEELLLEGLCSNKLTIQKLTKTLEKCQK